MKLQKNNSRLNRIGRNHRQRVRGIGTLVRRKGRGTCPYDSILMILVHKMNITLLKNKNDMIKDFESLTFTIFRGCSMEKFTEVMWNHGLLNEYIDTGKAKCVRNKELPVESYLNPVVTCLYKFSWWESSIYPNIVFFMSNMSDGFMTLCRQLRKSLHCESIECRLCKNDNPFPLNEFCYTNPTGEVRYIRSMKEDKWSFFEMGKPLSFEDLSLYKKRLHKDKMNIDIIFRYLKEMGIYFETIDKKIKECYSFERTTI